MVINLNETKPVGLCITTEEMFDTKRFLLNYCDGLILKNKDLTLKNRIVSVKRELNSFNSQPKFFHGYQAVMVSNIDKIIGLVEARYPPNVHAQSANIIMSGKDLISRILRAEKFEDISGLQADFRSKVTLPTYKIFISTLRKYNVDIV